MITVGDLLRYKVRPGVARSEAQTVVVPLLRLVAAVLAVLLLPVSAAAARADAAPQPMSPTALVLWALGFVLFAAAALRRPRRPMPDPKVKPLSVPTDDDLLCLVRQRDSGATLRQICEQVWPFLHWHPPFEGEPSATTVLRKWPCHPPAATPAVWVRDRMTVLSAQGAVRLAPRAGAGDPLAALRWVAAAAPARPGPRLVLLALGLSTQSGCDSGTLVAAGVALLALSCAGLGALVQGWRQGRAVGHAVQQLDRRIGRLESRGAEATRGGSRRSLLALLLAPLALRPGAARAAPAPAPAAPRRPPQWAGAFGWVYFTARLWQAEGRWRLWLLDLPGHEPTATGAETFADREAAYSRACALIEASGYPVSRSFRRPLARPDAQRAACAWGGPVEYHRIGSLTRREVPHGRA